MLLDNLLRGGFPEFLGAGGGAKRVYHTFSRIHGDLERDYNNFQIDATYFSQGSGNYRDVNQNRRVDVLLFPGVRDFNLRQFLTLKQADGYNQLTVATAFSPAPGARRRGAREGGARRRGARGRRRVPEEARRAAGAALPAGRPLRAGAGREEKIREGPGRRPRRGRRRGAPGLRGELHARGLLGRPLDLRPGPDP